MIMTLSQYLGSKALAKNVNLGHLNINSLRNKFDSRSKLNKGKVDIFLINKFKLDRHLSKQFQ